MIAWCWMCIKSSRYCSVLKKKIIRSGLYVSRLWESSERIILAEQGQSMQRCLQPSWCTNYPSQRLTIYQLSEGVMCEAAVSCGLRQTHSVTVLDRNSTRHFCSQNASRSLLPPNQELSQSILERKHNQPSRYAECPLTG